MTPQPHDEREFCWVKKINDRTWDVVIYQSLLVDSFGTQSQAEHFCEDLHAAHRAAVKAEVKEAYERAAKESENCGAIWVAKSIRNLAEEAGR